MTTTHSRGRGERDSIPTRASLLGRLKNWEDEESWNDFVRTYSGMIRGFARQSGLTESEAKEVEQDTLLCVAKKIHEFKSDPRIGTFKAWLFKLTRWRVADQFRKRLPQAVHRTDSGERSDDTPTIERIPVDPQLDESWNAEWRRHILETAIARASRGTNPKHLQIFDLYSVRKWPAARVAREMGVSLIQVYLIHHRLLKRVRREAAYLESKLE